MFNPNDYEMVQERLPKWWADNPDGAIETEMIVDRPDYCVFVTKLYRTHADLKPTATGWARTIYDTNKQTREFGLELAETSSIGRALANYIYSGAKRASREEMSKITRQKIVAAASEPYIPVPKEDDPWTIKEVPPTAPAVDAIELVKETLGATVIDPNVEACEHGNMIWKTGVSGKTRKPWGHFACAEKPYSCGPRWYEIAADGTWKPQAKRG